MSYQIVRGDAAHLPLPDHSVDLIVTSPPYFGLRSYKDRGEHYDGQIGAETTPAEYVAALIGCTREWIRVLKPSGSMWINLGDKYARNGGGGNGSSDGTTGRGPRPASRANGAPEKSLIGTPWRYALACIDDLGLILRAEVIWCLSGGARVYARTPSGDRPIMLRDLARAYQPENVQLWNGHKWTQVLGWNRTPDDDGALEIELRTGERIGCTTGHEWPTSRGLVRAGDLRVGDIIDTTRLPEPAQPVTPAGLPDDDIGWLVGLYIAEGSRSGTTLQFAGHVKERERHARLERIAAAYDGTFALYEGPGNSVSATLRGSVLAGIIDRYVSVGTAKTKRLRRAAWQRSDQFLSAVMDGYLSGDGHYDAKNNRWRLGFAANDEWATDLRTIAARVGAVVRLRRCVHRGNYGNFPGWRGEWRWTRTTHHNAKQDGEIVAIRRSRARDFYDVGVADEPHLFALASGVLTHNSKPNPLPESVTDRVRRSHEQWFHFTVQPRYYSNIDTIREPHTSVAGKPRRHSGSAFGVDKAGRGGDGTRHTDGNPLGKLPGSVWSIPTQPLRVPPELGIDHFAAFPMEWPRRIIRGWSPPAICTSCGEGRVAVTAVERETGWVRRTDGSRGGNRNTGESVGQQVTNRAVHTVVGETCACPQPSSGTEPAIVLDPFGGTGTTALIADVEGRHGISVDMSADYCRLARWRLSDDKQRAKAANTPTANRRKR